MTYLVTPHYSFFVRGRPDSPGGNKSHNSSIATAAIVAWGIAFICRRLPWDAMRVWFPRGRRAVASQRESAGTFSKGFDEDATPSAGRETPPLPAVPPTDAATVDALADPQARRCEGR